MGSLPRPASLSIDCEMSSHTNTGSPSGMVVILLASSHIRQVLPLGTVGWAPSRLTPPGPFWALTAKGLSTIAAAKEIANRPAMWPKRIDDTVQQIIKCKAGDSLRASSLRRDAVMVYQ